MSFLSYYTGESQETREIDFNQRMKRTYMDDIHEGLNALIELKIILDKLHPLAQQALISLISQ